MGVVKEKLLGLFKTNTTNNYSKPRIPKIIKQLQDKIIEEIKNRTLREMLETFSSQKKLLQTSKSR